jgi:O-acetylhomoserine (thiol)-lyase
MRLHSENALGLATFLRQRSDVSAVNYPGLADSPFRERVQRYLGGKGGGLLTLGLGSQPRAFAFINNLRRVKRAANLGETQTLIIHPASTIFREYDQADRQRMGVPDDLVRVSVGIEDLSTIVEDFQQALDASHKEPL